MVVKVSTIRFKVDKRNEKNEFGLWQVKVKDLLIQWGLRQALKGALVVLEARKIGNLYVSSAPYSN